MAEEFSLWDSETFDAPYTDGVIAISPVINNNSGATGVRFVVLYEAMNPSDGAADISVVIESEVAPGKWVPIANQFRPIRNIDYAPTRIINLTPEPVFDPGSDTVIIGDQPDGARVSNTFGYLPDKFRVKVLVKDSQALPLQSVTLSASGTKI
jgi:hypothetical protein